MLKAKKKSKAAKSTRNDSLAEYTNSPSKSAQAWKDTFGELLQCPPTKTTVESFVEPCSSLKQDLAKNIDSVQNVSELTSAEEARALEIEMSVSQKAGVETDFKCQPSAGSVSL